VAENLLTLDSSSKACSISVSSGEKLLGEVFLDSDKNHSELLLEAMSSLLEALDWTVDKVDAFGVVAGPGSFTGLRVGIGTIQGLALAHDKPVVGISSLQTLAAQCPWSGLPISAWIDARKKEVYAGTFHWTGGQLEAVGSEAVLPPEAALDKIEEDVLFVGCGALRYRSLIVRRLGPRAHFAPWQLNSVRSSTAAMLALEAFRRGEAVSGDQLLPRYMRLSEAEINWSKQGSDGAIRG